MAIPLGCVGTIFYYPTRIAYDDAVAGHIEVDIRIGRDKHVVAYRHLADHHGVGAYPHSVAYSGRAFALVPILSAYRYTRCYIAITADFRLCIDNDRPVVAYKKSFAYFSLCGKMKGIFFIQYFEAERIIQIQQLML